MAEILSTIDRIQLVPILDKYPAQSSRTGYSQLGHMPPATLPCSYLPGQYPPIRDQWPKLFRRRDAPRPEVCVLVGALPRPTRPLWTLSSKHIPTLVVYLVRAGRYCLQGVLQRNTLAQPEENLGHRGEIRSWLGDPRQGRRLQAPSKECSQSSPKRLGNRFVSFALSDPAVQTQMPPTSP